MAKTSALSSNSEAIHTRTDGSGVAESEVAVIGVDGSDSVVGTRSLSTDDLPTSHIGLDVNGATYIYNSGLDQWERWRTADGDNKTIGVPSVGLMGHDGTNWDRCKTGGGTEGAGVLRVTIANDSTGVLSVDDNGSTISIDDGAGNISIDDGGNSITVDNAQLSVVGTGTEAAAMRVTIATDSTGVLSVDDNGGNLSIDDGGNSITVDGTVAVSALPALVAGTANIGDVDVLTLPGSLTGKAEDVASGPGDVGIPNLGVRNDTPTALTDTDGDYTMMATDKYGRVQIAPVRSLPKTVAVSGSLGITTAATWDERAVWAVPASTLFAPKMARAAVTTASTRTLILAGKQLATFNPGTNTFTATGSVTGNDFYDRLMYRIAVTHSATADTMTATYTDQDGNTGNTTTGLVIPSAAVAGDWYEFILAANDFGVKAVTAFADTAAPTSVVDEVWGFRTLLEDLGTAITPHIAYLGEGLQVPNGESIVILFNAAATTAQQRFASVIGDLVAA